MRRPSFIVVTLTVTTLFVMGSAAKLVQPLIPPEATNPLALDDSEFMRQAGAHRVRWWPLERSTFNEARRQNRMVVLFIGTAWSKFARNMDTYVFPDRRVVSFLNRNALCIRVDTAQHPAWLNAFMPLTRAVAGSLEEAQVYILDSQGSVLDVFLKVRGETETGPAEFLDVLTRSRQRLEEVYEAQPDEVAPAAAHRSDVAALETPAAGVMPPFEDFDAFLSSAIHARYGGFPHGPGLQRLRPRALEYLLLRGEIAAFRRAFDPMLRSPIVDWVDGGFFRLSIRNDWSLIEFDKTAAGNAQMLGVLALAHALTGDPLYRRLAEDTFRFLDAELSRDGLVRAARVGDEQRRRSIAYSFSPRDLRDLRLYGSWSSADLDFARDALGLRVEHNPAMVVKVQDPAVLEHPSFEHLLSSLRQVVRRRPVQYVEAVQLDINGVVADRMIYSGRLLGSQKMVEAGTRLFERLQVLRTSNDVFHALPGATPYLHDYLSFAGAALEHFLATGDDSILTTGFEVLQRAEFLFGQEQDAGAYRMFLNPPQLGLGPIAHFEVTDTHGESALAKMGRLQLAYAQLLSPETRAVGGQTFTRWAGIASRIGLSGAGFWCLSLIQHEAAAGFVVGPDAAERAARLSRDLPTRLISPAAGLVRPDIQLLGPGLYAEVRGEVLGPLSTEQMKRLLPRSLG
ncbi:MAG TPA: DUF255 domain-containing protein [Fimbriimonadaceae bacterium]|nr:DUF255 domain-containing protein [Fimbriimonadaceae bacterium]